MAVCIHPFEAAPTGALSRYFLGNLVGNLYDTGLAAALLIYGGVLERHPNLRIVLYHAGGALPALVGRLDMGYRLVPECRNAIPRPPSTYVAQFHFDIIAHNRDNARPSGKDLRRRSFCRWQRLSAAGRPRSSCSGSQSPRPCAGRGKKNTWE